MTIRSQKLSDLLAGYKVFTPTGNDPLVSGISLDSRSANKGCLFCAVQGDSGHGAEYIPLAIQRGAVAILHDGLAALPAAARNVVAIELPGLRAELGNLAKRLYSTDRSAVTAITGTNGKTSCCINYAQLSSALGSDCGTVGTLGWGQPFDLETTGLTTPDVFTLHDRLARMRDASCERCVVEASSHALAQGRLDGVDIRTAVFTNLSRDHLDYHGTAKNYGDAKAKLFCHSGLENIVLNADDEFSAHIADTARYTNEKILYSQQHRNADVCASDIRLDSTGIRASVSTPWGGGELQVPQLGRFNLSNALAVISALCLDGFLLDDLLVQFSRLRPVPGRMQVLDAPNLPTLVVDYAHTPDALEKVLQALTEHCDSRLWLVFGCGGDRDQGKRAEMGAIAARYANQIIVTNDNPRSEDPQAIVDDILSGFEQAALDTQDRTDRLIVTQLDRREAIEMAVVSAASDDWVVIAGKGHENYQQIGARKEPFDDLLVAQSALHQRTAKLELRS